MRPSVRSNTPSVIRALGLGVLLACTSSPAAEQSLCSISTSGAVSGPGAELCAHLVGRFATLIDTLPMAGTASLKDGALFENNLGDEQAWTMQYARTDLFPAGLDAAPDPRHRDVFWHEIAHEWPFPLLQGGKHISTGYRYGTEAPDWLDEGWAVWAESSDLRTRRMRAIPADARPSLRALVEMPHPISGTRPITAGGASSVGEVVAVNVVVTSPCRGCDWIADSLRGKYRIDSVRVQVSGRTDTIVAWTSEPPMSLSPSSTLEQRHFYPLAYSLLRYIRETGGTAAVRELIARYRRDPVPIAATLEGLPGLPATIDALEAGWHAFLALRSAEPE
jgi:hypothetical protein